MIDAYGQATLARSFGDTNNTNTHACEPGRLALTMLATLHALLFDLAATQAALGSATVGAALAADAGPDRVAQLAELGAASFAPLRAHYLLY